MLRITFLLLFINSVCVYAQKSGYVISVSDGDTFTMLVDDNKQVKIRLHGIDCPEKRQDYGQVAKKYTSDAVFHKNVIAYYKDIDRYGRVVAIIKLESGKILNEELLKQGLAWHYRKYDNNDTWSSLEKRAKASKKGLWQQSNPLAPWDFRHNRK